MDMIQETARNHVMAAGIVCRTCKSVRNISAQMEPIKASCPNLFGSTSLFLSTV